MKRENIRDSIGFWDRHADLWHKIAYDEEGRFLNFPTSRERQDITIRGIEKSVVSKDASIIDIGCADGELVRALLRRGFSNVMGIDNSAKMIERARILLKGEMPAVDTDKIFSIGSADNIYGNERFDFISAMGLIEYVLSVDDFFAKISRMLKPGGRAFIESRNKLFNLFSANSHTCQSSADELVKELADIERFSPVKKKEDIESIVRDAYISIGENLRETGGGAGIKEKHEKYPFDLHQFTPKEIESFSEKHGLRLEHVVYYHPHPFLPKYENDFPEVFNRVAVLMRPFGYIPLGATICSSFVAFIRK